jgi:outer membrane protein TolC
MAASLGFVHPEVRAQSGSVSVQQSTTSGGSSSVNTTVINVQISGSFSGSVPGTDTGGPLTLERAIQLGLKYNLGAVSAGAALRQVRAQRLLALSKLLPSITASLSETVSKTDLETLGLSASAFGKGAALPVTVGPYHYYDLRTSISFDAFDRSALHSYRSAQESERASEFSDRDARELIVLAVGGEYLRVLADAALVEAQEAQVISAKASYNQAVAQNQAGTRSLVDTERSQVELQTEQQRLTSQKADLIKEKRTLARLIGYPLDSEVAPSEKLVLNTAAPMPLDDALKHAMEQRADLKSAAADLRAAEESFKSAHSERLPTVSVSGYLGVQGIDPNAGNGVFSGAASLNVPVWQGGKIHADEEQARGVIDRRRAEYRDRRGSVELDVRNAYTDLETAADQVQVAESNRRLALQTLQQSQDRFQAGVATSVEVVQSQESLAAANRDYVSSLYAHNLAKIGLARAVGSAETNIPQFLKGN